MSIKYSQSFLILRLFIQRSQEFLSFKGALETLTSFERRQSFVSANKLLISFVPIYQKNHPKKWIPIL